MKAGGRTLEYILIQSVRRDVKLQALPHGETRVYAPKTMRLREIDALVKQNMDELLRMHEKLDAKAAEMEQRHPMTEGSEVLVEGERLRLRLSRGPEVMSLGAGELRLRLAEPEDPEQVRGALRRQLVQLALQRYRERLEFYAPRVGVTYGRVTIREQRSRWGSCSSRNNLNFNWKLIMAPPGVLDYVVIHELCHLHEFNHSPRFWALVEAQMPEYEAWKKWLKEHGEELGV